MMKFGLKSLEVIDFDSDPKKLDLFLLRGILFIAIGNSLIQSRNFPPPHTVRATFTAYGAPSN